jgi:O-antigen/teichoic acid export membrane protein
MQSRGGFSGVPIRFVDQAIVSIGNFAVGALAARTLGPGHFGVFALIWTVLVFAIAVQWAFIISPMQSTVPRVAESARPSVHSALMAHSLIISFCAAIIATLLLSHSSGGVANFGTALSLGGAFSAVIVQDYVRRWLLVRDQPGHAILSDTLRHGGAIVGLFWLWKRGGDLEAVLETIGIAAAFGCLPIIGELRSADWRIAHVLRYASLHSFSGRLLAPYVGVQAGISAAPIYYLTAFVSSAAAGGYRVFVYLISPVIIMTEALETFLPLRAAQFGDDIVGRRRLLARWRWMILTVSSCYAVAMIVSGKWLVVLFYGHAFEQFAPLRIPLVVAALFQNLSYIRNVELRVEAAFKKILYGEVIAATTLLMLYLILPRDSLGWGVALAALVSQMVKLLYIFRRS